MVQAEALILTRQPTPEAEAAALLQACGGDLMRAVGVIEQQLNVLYQRAQVLVSLAGVVITVTGFSGRLIAGTSRPAQVFLIAGLSVVVLAAVYVFARVMTLHWVTSDLVQGAETTLHLALRRREAKTRAYRFGGVMLCAGLLLYAVAVSLMLLDPLASVMAVR